MSKWEIGIRTDAYTYNHGGRCFIVYEGYDNHEQRYHTIDSDCFEEITPEDQNQAQSIIHGMVTIANGAFVLGTRNIHKYIEIDHSQIMYDGQKYSLYKNDFIPEMNPYKGRTPLKIIFDNINFNRPYNLIELSRAYSPIREILFQAGCFIDDPNLNRNISTWTILYAMYDTIYFYSEEMARGYTQKKNEERVSEHLKIDIPTLKRFTQTVNNFDYLGIFSRHGRQRFEPPKKPMELMEAVDFVFKMAMAFFEAFIIHEQQKEENGI